MRIAWFTPLSKRTGIAKYSLSAVKELSKRIQVDVWTMKMPDNLHIEADNVHEIILNHENLRKLNYYYDAVVYNMGNNIDFHCEIYEFYRRVKGIVILHDKTMHHFFSGYFLEKLKRPDKYISIMDYYYGTKGRNVAVQSLKKSPPVWETESVAEYPLFENSLWNTYGIVVHSKDLLHLIKKISPVPARHIFHPFYQYPKDNLYLSREELNIPDNKIILLQYGHIVPNKNVDKVLEAITNDKELRNRVYFIVAGDHNSSYGRYIKHLIQKKGLYEIVLLTGYVSDDVLYSYIKHADACINLRFPSTEGASGSLIEQLYFKKPIIATRTGFFAEIPDKCILKIEPPINIEELSHAIKLLIDNKEYRKELALNGSKFAYQNFSPDVYAKNLLSFITEVSSFKPSVDFIDKVSDEVSNFITQRTCEGFINRVAGEITKVWSIDDITKAANRALTASNNISTEFKDINDEYKGRFSLKEKFINLGWRYKNTIKKIPLLNSISRKFYHSVK